MAKLRFQALGELMNREAKEVVFPSAKATDYYGELVFNMDAMSKYLGKDAYKAVKVAIDKGESIDRKVADTVASGMKAWAMERGATHYTHWFQPLTDGTAEKHDGFLDYGDNGHMIESFSGKLLAQQEPDASSFPSGGIRQTFEARGYTAWDVSSPAFIVGTTLCIPTVFISYTGEALDYKTPFLKALSAVDKAAVAVAQYFDKDVRKVHTNLGWEQEYFLIDTALYQARPDLIVAGRTLMGHSSAKDQQLDDHYFGSIPERVSKFMIELEIESHRLGIPVKTRHNEVAPNQFEVAPIFEEANLANDHNLLLMDLMKRVARHHKFEVLLHEKPFAGINGSGKHNNWSLSTDKGVVLMAPGKNPKGNLQFLTFVVNAIAAVYKSQDLLRASILTSSNSHRLGANEAPPAILSVFTGSQIADTLDNLAEKITDQKMTPDEKTALKLGIGRIPEILLDNTDRNRTSPFAFTGNRFEFRAVGSSTNCAAPLTALSAAMALQLEEFKKDVDALIASGVKKDEAIFQTIKKVILESNPIRFNGDGYSDEWKEEAAKRGLTNITSVPESLTKYLDANSKKILCETGIMTERELEARVEVEMEKFMMKIQIESRTLGDLAINHIVPTAVAYQTQLIQNVQGIRDIFSEKEFNEIAAARKELIKTISGHISAIKAKVKDMTEARKKCNVIESGEEKAFAYDKEVRPYLDDIRYHIDKLELTVDNEMWPLPKYRELLFSR
ncbi:glutamine synthetase III family protein [Carboxylicivirga linearis]|uniref:Glutamine synthetase III n=1 Tax=Carboxylicivirga linearis TaxID=1628157 RepID=A0ABS5JWT4_9BACT|nr:glutamine synthetase III [Carboxylicivirga linearis]MBS2098934.1 glutamine synthetase III [Carboxylicivirga linearis]